jgi:hypothetical protein
MRYVILAVFLTTTASAQQLDPALVQDAFNTVSNQRNNALNEAAVLAAKLAKAQRDIDGLVKQLEEAKKSKDEKKEEK